MPSRVASVPLLLLGLLAAAPASAATGSLAADGESLLLSGPCAKHVSVQADPALRNRITVRAEAEHQEEIDRLEAGTTNGAARIGPAPGRERCWEPVPHGSFRPTLVLFVRVPAAFPVAVAEAGLGDYAIGTVGPLTLRLSGDAAVTADAVDGDAGIELSGTGKVRIDRLEAEHLEVRLSGDGSVRVGGGRIGDLSVSESGVGAVRIDPAVRNAALQVSGMGTIALGGVTGSLTRSVSGMATITVGGRAVAARDPAAADDG